ncbi:thioredoxin domain-containing protein [Lactobacillus crispatus]|uniref:Thioredoxin domain-containing protein n=1 Tax=Lactobacillus crispatus TaxID=47770 RepID=A0AAW6XGF2_9LACO|nr:thioredoxin domain-containing protein [Lactobacillus crispatus]MDK6502411.1 thioredoxin domain-containing protein [Lactobacillus crispatus]PLA29973.1 thiol reductase thioredoxin [Lactobacillus crispatus]
MQLKKETKVKIIAVSCAMIFLLFAGVIGFNQHVSHELSQKNIVKIKTNNDSTILFYRDDCKSCRSIFSYTVMKKDLFRKNIQLVNTNQPKNRHYIAEYKLTEVPTFIHLKYGKSVEKYSGTNIEKIDQIIRGD